MNEFAASILSGVTTAVVWAVLLWVANLVRNIRVERTLRSSLSRIGTSYGDEGFGATVKNETRISILVRDVTFLLDDPAKGIDLLYKCPTHEFLITEKRTKKPMTFNTQTRGREVKRETTPHGFVELPPYTGGIWQLDPGFYFKNTELVPIGARATVEYKTFLGNPKLIVVRTTEASSKLIKDQYAKFLDYIRRKREVEQAPRPVRWKAAEDGVLPAPDRCDVR